MFLVLDLNVEVFINEYGFVLNEYN